MEIGRFEAMGPYLWRLPRQGAMRVPAVIVADAELIEGMDDRVGQQIRNVAGLPGIVRAAYAMPDAHWGYGFPIGGVAAFDPGAGGVVSAGGVGFDISCGVRLLATSLGAAEIRVRQQEFAHELSRAIPAGVGSRGRIHLDPVQMDAMLAGGAQWAVAQGWGTEADLDRIEERGRMAGARPDMVSDRAKRRQRDEMGTLGSGNHYLEVQEVAEVIDADAARAYGLEPGQAVVMIHCGSRGLGHQIGTEFLREMALAAPAHGIDLPDRELACAPVESELGQRYLGAMRAGRCGPAALRASQGRDAGAGARPPGPARSAARRGATGADRWQHGNRVLGPGGRRPLGIGGAGVGLPRRRTRDEPPRSRAQLDGQRRDGRTRGPRHHRQEPLAPRHRGRGARRLQGRHPRGRGRREGRPCAPCRAAGADDLHQGLIRRGASQSGSSSAISRRKGRASPVSGASRSSAKRRPA